jgi:hypothetical protein
LSSRSKYIYQLAVLCREMVAEHSAGRRNLVEDPSWYLLNICCFEVYLRRRLCTQIHFLLCRCWMSVNSPTILALSDSNQRSFSYPALNETWYRLSKRLFLRVCGVLLFQPTDEGEVFTKRAAQMADSDSLLSSLRY